MEAEIAFFNQNLAPYGVKLYHDYDEMLKHPGLEAVVIATVTTVHAEQTIKAIEANKHVLCEKPLSTSVEIVRHAHSLLFCSLQLSMYDVEVTLTDCNVFTVSIRR